MEIPFQEISVGKLRRYFSWANFADFFRFFGGIFGSYKILGKIKPDVVFSKGGYVGLPVTIAARFKKIPVILHESDAIIGLANRIGFKFAKKICLSFEETKLLVPKKYQRKILVTGSPVRKFIMNGKKEDGYKFTGFDKFRPVILIMGGSQGAAQINELVKESLDELLKKFQVVHLTGKGNLDIGVHKKGYKQYEFLNEDLKNIYAISEMVVTRGGANSLFEIALLRKKALIMPLGQEASRGDQIENAKIFSKELGWGMICGKITSSQFISAITLAFENEVNKSKKFKNGTAEITNLILKTTK